MALVIYGNDFICFTIIGGAIFTSLWTITRQKVASSRCNNNSSLYESLLVFHEPEDGDYIRLNDIGASQTGHVSSEEFWTSCWRGVHPVWLLGLRLVCAIAMAGILIWDVRCYDTTIFLYYTEWTFSLTIVYFMLGAIISAKGCLEYSNMLDTKNEERIGFLKGDLEEIKSRGTMRFRTNKISCSIKLQSFYEKEEIEGRAGFSGYLMQIVYQSCAGAVVITDFVFWCVIVPFLSIHHFSLNPLMICMHTLNAVFLLLDTALNSLTFPWFRLAYFVLWSCIYVIFQWVIHACGFSWWPYPFLELDVPWAPLWYFCLALIHIPCYAFYALIVKAKNVLFTRWFPHAYVRSN